MKWTKKSRLGKERLADKNLLLIFETMAQELTQKEMARQLRVSTRTIQKRVYRIRACLADINAIATTSQPTNQQTNKQMPESVQGFKKFESFCKIRPKRVRVEAKNGASIHEVVLENLHKSQGFPNGFFVVWFCPRR